MSKSRQPENELKLLEAQLSSLSPAMVGLDRDRLMFLAGQAASSSSVLQSSRMARWLMYSALAASLLLAVMFGSLWYVQRGEFIAFTKQNQLSPAKTEREGDPNTSRLVESVPVVPLSDAELAKTQAEFLAQGRMWELRNLVLSKGVEALPGYKEADGPRSIAPSIRRFSPDLF